MKQHSIARPIIAVLVALGLVALAVSATRAQGGTQPYGVSSEVVLAEGFESIPPPVVVGPWVAWIREQSLMGVMARNLDTGVERQLLDTTVSFDHDGSLLLLIDLAPDNQSAVTLFRLSDGQRTEIAPPLSQPNFRRYAQIDSGRAAWLEWSDADQRFAIRVYTIATGELQTLPPHPVQATKLTLSGTRLVWGDGRHGNLENPLDLYSYDLATGQEQRLTTAPKAIKDVALEGNNLVWSTLQNNEGEVRHRRLDSGEERVIATAPVGSELDISGNLVVLTAPGGIQLDLHGYDLATNQPFIISRAIGNQISPSLSGTRVVWFDDRRSGAGRYSTIYDLRSATLTSGSAPVPPVYGAPAAVDAKIEIVWPGGGAPVSQAERANISAWPFLQGTLALPACQWQPGSELWRALNSEPARMVATGRPTVRYSSQPIGAFYGWEYNDVDVSAARNPANRLYFFVRTPSVPSRTNVWAHAVDARTYFPQQDTPAGTAPVAGQVDAKIEIVWPHGGAPVSQATRANLTGMLFIPGSLNSVPTSWDGTVRLMRALNNGMLEQVLVGQKRIMQGQNGSYPVWDFNDVDVSAARDPMNKLTFMMDVEGLTTFPNVWVHGVDARTIFPQMDVPTSPCTR